MVFWVLTSQILVHIARDAHQIAAPPRAQLGALCQLMSTLMRCPGRPLWGRSPFSS